MSSCLSVSLMGAFTVGLLVADVWFSRNDRIINHAMLGGIATALFFTMCQYGYELVNWSLLGVVVLYMLSSIGVFHYYRQRRCDKEDEEDEECEDCC